jgi:hypothetical protein
VVTSGSLGLCTGGGSVGGGAGLLLLGSSETTTTDGGGTKGFEGLVLWSRIHQLVIRVS